jgi:hypothetical protein
MMPREKLGWTSPFPLTERISIFAMASPNRENKKEGNNQL